jgi:glycosyltransferase involved in cell wall biosynthesis
MYNSIADVFVLPSNYEGLPVVIIEALSHGKPVVASNVGGVSELVADGVNGYLVNNVPEEFAEKIDTLLKDENLIARFSKNARNTYEEKFTLEQMVKKYGEVYDEIVAKS